MTIYVEIMRWQVIIGNLAGKLQRADIHELSVSFHCFRVLKRNKIC